MFKLLEKFTQRDIKVCYDKVFGTEEGKVLLRHFAKKYRIESVPFNANNPMDTAFKLGQQHVIKSILHVLAKDLLDFSEVHTSHEVKKKEEDIV